MEETDFLNLLKQGGHLPAAPGPLAPADSRLVGTEGTTILAVRYAEGVLVAGDRRATMGNTVIYDRADKVLSIDDEAVMALSGSPAIAYEIARLLEMSLQHYRRSQLQSLSLNGKLRVLGRLLRDNLAMAMQGIGAVIPILAAYDPDESTGRIYFYDLLGAQFESVDFCTTGSGSHVVRGALYYLDRWSQPPLARMDEGASLQLVLRMLETAAEYDTATGGFRRAARVYPQVVRVSAAGITPIDEERLEELYSTHLVSQ
ncbi:MAG: proteasome subunit alpha [Candidatus Latescibacterota bacterium]